jgi:SNF2 family DNA or RNA helicase
MSTLPNTFRRLSITPNKQQQLQVPSSATKKQLKIQYNQCVTEARELEKNYSDNYEKLMKCVSLYRQAYSLFDHDKKLEKKIQTLQRLLDEEFEENRNPNVIDLDTPPRPAQKKTTTTTVATVNRFTLQQDGFIYDSKSKVYRLPATNTTTTATDKDNNQWSESILPYKLPAAIYSKLYPYQRDSIKWFWYKHCESTQKKLTSGGILGDDMGLGKTVQVTAYLCGLFYSKLVDHVVIGMPVSVLQNWKKEFAKWAPKITVYMFHQLSKNQREDTLCEFSDTGGVLLTTYGMITSQVDLFVRSFKDYEYRFDYIFLDEGHKVKNANIQLSQCLRKLPIGVSKFILTGTPIQNNLMEMWALFDYIFDGKLLGTSKTFKSEFDSKIVRGQEKDADDFERQLGAQLSEKLRTIIAPYFLRREKSVVLNASSSVSISKKNDLICWIKNTEKQNQIYSTFLESADVRAVLNKSQSALAAITVLKQICSHPNLLAANSRKSTHVKDMIQDSGKLQFLEILLKQLFSEKRRVLIFSQSVQMLHIVSKLLDLHNYTHLQIDGTITDSRERQRLIDSFNAPNSKHFCFLLTSQVGGFGITLTSADRVVLFDPSWNPAVDSQAVDRAYRIGQTKNVIVYRLITCGTIEEKVSS